MSSTTFNLDWRQAVAQMYEALDIESPDNPKELPKKPKELYEQYMGLYLTYLQVFRKLEGSYDQVVHPQKRPLIKEMLEAVMGRLLELRDLLVRFCGSDHPDFGNICLDLKLGPRDLEVPIPHYFVDGRKAELAARNKLIASLVEQYNPGSSKARGGGAATMSLEEAVSIIQVNERGRQGRHRAKFMQEIRKQEERERRVLESGEAEMAPAVAALRIQCVYRGHLARKAARAERESELVFIGMERKPMTENPQARAEANRYHRKETQDEHMVEFEDAKVRLRQQLLDSEGPDMRDDIRKAVHAWFTDYKQESGKYPDFPSEADGGSKPILNPPPPPTEEELAAEAAEAAEAAKRRRSGKTGSTTAKPRTPASKTGAGRKGKGDPDADSLVAKIPASAYVADMRKSLSEYASVWQDRDEGSNFAQKHDDELIREELRPGVMEEVRLAVDDALRTELAGMKAAFERDLKKKKKKKSAGSRTPGSSKSRSARTRRSTGAGSGKSKPKPKSRRKGPKDITADVTTEDLLAELVMNGIVDLPSNTSLKDYKGAFTTMRPVMEQAGVNVDPSALDLRRALAETCALPLGSGQLRAALGPAAAPKAVLLYGPKSTGKRTLVDGLVTDVGAAFFDLSPETTAGKFVGKTGYLMHVVFKLAKLMAPSVIYFNNAEKVFRSKAKKAAKRAKDDPFTSGRIRKDLLKEMKKLKPSDQVVVIGAAERPQDGDFKSLTTVFSRQFMVPSPDYGARLNLWEMMIRERVGDKKAPEVLANINTSALAKVTDGYTSGVLHNVVQTVLSDRRLRGLERKPLVTEDMIEPLSKYDPVFAEDDAELRKWAARLPREKLLATEGTEEETAASGVKKGKKRPGMGGATGVKRRA